MNVNAPQLLSHNCCIDLTHVASAIWLANLANVKIPCLNCVSGNTHPTIVGHNFRVKCKNCLVFSSYPSHLQTNLQKKHQNLKLAHSEKITFFKSKRAISTIYFGMHACNKKRNQKFPTYLAYFTFYSYLTLAFTTQHSLHVFSCPSFFVKYIIPLPHTKNPLNCRWQSACLLQVTTPLPSKILCLKAK